MKIFNILILLILLISVASCQNPLKVAQKNINWTQSVGSQIHGVTNGTAIHDVVTFSQSAQASHNISRGIYVSKCLLITVAMKDDWSIVSIGTDSADVIQDALDIGGNIHILDSMSVDSPAEIVADDTHLEISDDATLTATSAMVGVIVVDPDSEGHDINDISISGGHINCDSKADSAVNVSGHYLDDSTGWLNINGVSAQNSVVSSFSINSSSLSSIVDCASFDSPIGLLLEEGVVNFVIDNFNSNSDDIGIQIGDTNPAAHTRCEGIRIKDSILIGNQYNIKIISAFGVYISNCILDFASYDNLYVIGNTANVHIDSSYLGNSASAETSVYGSCVAIGDTISGFDVSHCDIVNAYYYGISVWSNTPGSTSNITISDNFMFGNGRKPSEGGDIQNYAGMSVGIIGNHLYSDKSASHYSYNGIGSPDRTTFMGNFVKGDTQFSDTNLVKVHNQGVAD